MSTSADKPDVNAAIASLKDFQRRTADLVFRRLYIDDDKTDRFLIADEVGLGKTIVTKAVIAKAVEHLWDSSDRLDIIYICSNSEIARQNIRRLHFGDEDSKFSESTRLTLLPLYVGQLSKRKLNFISLTPSTSLDLRGSQGAWRERAFLYAVLKEAWGIKHVGARNLLQGYVRNRDWWQQQLKGFVEKHKDKDDVLIQQIIESFRRNVDLRNQFEELADACRAGVSQSHFQRRNELIGELRRILASECLGRLKPALIILDEFQRFKYLLDGQDEIASLARQLFRRSNSDGSQVKILLISATPYKMYTQAGDQSDDHYSDLLRTLEFLESDATKIDAFNKSISEFKDALIDGEEAIDRLREAQSGIERVLQRVMCRTERLATTHNRNGMVKEILTSGSPLASDDVIAFGEFERIANKVDGGETIEIWKSAPFPLELMDHHYAIKKKVMSQLKSDEETRDIIGSGLHFPSARIESYSEIALHNPRVRELLDQCVGQGAWQLLWVPPSLPYWASRGAYAEPNLRSFTKKLLFSSWKVAPKAIAGILSYEAERRMVATGSSRPAYSRLSERAGRLLRFAERGGRLTGLSLFTLLYPSPTWAKIDPLTIAQSAEGVPSIDQISAMVEEKIGEVLAPQLASSKKSGPVDQSWYWAAPLLIDREENSALLEWLTGLNDDGSRSEWAWLALVDDEDEDSLFSSHVKALQRVLDDPSSLGRPPEDLLRVLAKVVVASPAVIALRSLLRFACSRVPTSEHFGAAAWIALAFRSLFNLPETQALLRSTNDEERYWERVLDECIDGNLQSVLDEYVHMISESMGGAGGEKGDAYEISEEVANAVSLRTSVIQYDDLAAVGAEPSAVTPSASIRCRFAVRFGDGKSVDDEDLRQSSVRTAFNSPFRPFVLTSTSVGQEGLDFHPYCHAIVHWNLPSNPVDFEQREGRIHRFKGHFVRKNLADKYGLHGLSPIAGSTSHDPWAHIFSRAVKDRPADKSDIEPFWLLEGAHYIERHIPIFPLSRDVKRHNDLMIALARYRMVFGQPRQDELLRLVAERWSSSGTEQLLNLKIDLQPKIE